MNGRRATGMVGMRMADQHHLQPINAQLAQGRQHHALAQVAVATGRAGIVEQAVVARAQQHRQALPDIQLEHLDLALRQHLPGRPQRHQHQRPQPAQRHPTRQQQQQGAAADQQPGQQRQWLGNPGRLQLRQPSQQPKQQIQRPARQPQQRLTDARDWQQQRAEQCQRQHHNADPGHRDQVGQRRTQADRQAQSQHGRHQPDGDHPLRAGPGLPGPPAPKSVGETIDKHRDRRERQPEARQQAGQRLDQ
ncbi:hypothetical protein PSRE111525_20655 [Pseudomonas reidholzensis]